MSNTIVSDYLRFSGREMALQATSAYYSEMQMTPEEIEQRKELERKRLEQQKQQDKLYAVIQLAQAVLVKNWTEIDSYEELFLQCEHFIDCAEKYTQPQEQE